MLVRDMTIGEKYDFITIKNATLSRRGAEYSVFTRADGSDFARDNDCRGDPAKEPKSYKDRQKEWIAENDLKVGDKVRVLRKADDGEGGWDDTWVLGMNAVVGHTCTISYIRPCDYGVGIKDIDDIIWNVPYFILEKVETPAEEPKSYEDRQAEWIAENDLKVGDKVRVTLVETEADAWTRGEWTERMNGLDGTVCSVVAVTAKGQDIWIKDEVGEEWLVPYFVLEKIDRPGRPDMYAVGELVEALYDAAEAMGWRVRDPMVTTQSGLVGVALVFTSEVDE